ncbi:hypothetical protein ACVMHW_004002 [Bradyrhizobium diazoefficiens]
MLSRGRPTALCWSAGAAQHGARAVDQHGGDAGATTEIAHDLRHPVEVDGGEHDGIGDAAEGGHRIDRHDGR